MKGDAMTTLTTDSDARKDIPLARGLLDYFPAALAEVARLSKAGNDKHNPGEEMHHARGKSDDHPDCIMRHLAERGTVDDDGFYHDVKVAWRALALLQEQLEADGAPLARGARLPHDGECENDVRNRIAGECDTAGRIKDDYYTKPRYVEVTREEAAAFLETGAPVWLVSRERP